MDSQGETALQARLKTLQIIAFALIMGVAIFAAVVATLHVAPSSGAGAPAAANPASPVPVLRYIAGALGLTGCAIAMILTMPRGRRDYRAVESMGAASDAPDIQRLFGKFFVKRIAAYAMLEGPALFGAVLTLLSGNLNDLAFVAVPLVCMLLIFPTASKWDAVGQQG